MTQTSLPLRTQQTISRNDVPQAAAVGLSCEDEMVTLRFVEETQWGRSARQVRLDKALAEQLSRLLNDELDDRTWDFELSSGV